MQKFQILARSRLVIFLGGAALALVVAWPMMVAAQGKSDMSRDPNLHAHQNAKQPASDENLASQIVELRDQVTRLEAAIAKLSPSAAEVGGAPPANRSMPGGVAAKYSNCLECHQTRPSGPLPTSHREAAAGSAPPAPMAGMGGKKRMGMGMTGEKGMGSMKPAKSGMGGGRMNDMMGMMSNMMGMMNDEMGGMGGNKKPKGGMGMDDDEMEMAGMGAGGTSTAGGAAMAPANDDSIVQMMKMMKRMQMMKMMQMMKNSMSDVGTGGTAANGRAAMAPANDDSMMQMLKMMQMMKMMEMMQKSMEGSSVAGAAGTGGGAAAPPMMNDM
jgi:hypothetical protein